MQITYIRFNLASIPETASISQATLKLYVNTAGEDRVPGGERKNDAPKGAEITFYRGRSINRQMAADLLGTALNLPGLLQVFLFLFVLARRHCVSGRVMGFFVLVTGKNTEALGFTEFEFVRLRLARAKQSLPIRLACKIFDVGSVAVC
jgi:hypothetical protein